MELLLQMVEYERSYEIDLEEFLGVAKRIHLPEIQEWAATVLKEREDLWKTRQTQSTAKEST
jgi:putative hydrolase of HD superfamily